MQEFCGGIKPITQEENGMDPKRHFVCIRYAILLKSIRLLHKFFNFIITGSVLDPRIKGSWITTAGEEVEEVLSSVKELLKLRYRTVGKSVYF